MFGSYLQGFIGLAISLIGVVLLIVGLFDPGIWIVIGFLMIFGGGYMRYLSKQTTRTGDSLVDEGRTSAHAVQPINPSGQFSGIRDLDDGAYQLFLVEKYKIIKNPTLEKFVLDGVPYDSLTDALKRAHEREN